MLSPTSLPGVMFRESWWNLGLNWSWKYRETGKVRKSPGNKVLIELNSVLQLPTRYHRYRSVASRRAFLCYLFFGCSQATNG